MVALAQAAAHLAAKAAESWPLLALAGLAVAAVLAGLRVRDRLRRRADGERLARLRITLPELDTMGDQDFEYALRDLLVRDGWTARKVGGGGYQVADVIGVRPSLGRIVVQAKHTRVGGKVDSSVMYQVKGTAGPAHGADHAVVVTNGAFTRDAMAWGDRHGVRGVDRDRLHRWAHEGKTLHELLGLSARRSRLPWRREA
ncbi:MULTISPECIES: restriction endonuclease [Streptomyces]|uniref:Putative membrane protein n=1 Tax=Streptomyces venezuelae (strain ATCC 10712 / CBS 650.69 / DSM 40230 / JCM 4526 / NBRC 13096 / PD 04745) TaxID=953739 RepID=F2RCA6_STRVP|nr:restriction endonuclease [Streptomyces venezuelae]QES02190.1 restriction endonuclease [Streptomyces venezuelae ATCC 10712]CCA59357.1 putative membrane protein [Streptomyces venezuelae ATCC 10712]